MPPAGEQLAPSGQRARVEANLAALEVLRRLGQEERAATPGEYRALAAWSGWGAVPQVFDEQRVEWGPARERLRELAGEQGYEAARRTTINAHYTDPQVAAAMWEAVQALGFDEGRVLEPGCGAGIFLGLAPGGAELTGVELDPTTAAIAAALYPDAQVRAESFAATRLPDGYFEVAIGNVPFADVRLHDPRHNPGGHSLHNHFILKSLALVRPGGLVCVLTSHYTLDSGNPAARREISAMADLLGAVRLPTGAHRRAAGTDALMDLLILRRRAAGQPARDERWVATRRLEVDGQAVRVNALLVDRPDLVLGELRVGHGMYGNQTLQVLADRLEDTPARVRDALDGIVADARAAGLLVGPRDTSLAPAAGRDTSGPVALAPEGLWDGHLIAEPDGSFTIVNQGVREPSAVPASARAELRALLGLRDSARALLEAEASTVEDTPATDRLRAELRSRYEDYHRRYGPLNRYTSRRTGRSDPDTGEERLARVTPTALRLLRADPFAPLVGALEVFDEERQAARPAGLLSERVVAPRAPRLGADTPQDALAICLETHGRVDLDEIARLLGTELVDARERLGELVYHDPAQHRLVPAAEYLSGNVRVKLDQAHEAARERPELTVNVAALERVLPDDLGPGEIQPRMGAAWIDADTHREFLEQLLEDPSIELEHPGGTMWAVRGRGWTVKAASEWGTQRMPAPALAKAVLEQRPIQVTDETDDGRRVLNPTETAAAQEKAQAMQERFAEWCWEDPERARRLVGEYNRRFNAIVLRDYVRDGERLTLPGLARTFSPREHQRAAVARMLSEPAVGLFHVVGAGKTAEMVIGAMELRRLGLVAKPAVVVPNHMLEQFAREFLQLYPQARVLAASGEDLAGEKRRAFVARAAANEWDAVILTRSAFQRLPASHETQVAYRRRELEHLRVMLERAKGERGLTVKRLEKQLLAGEQQLEERLDGPKDPGLCFEQTGIDYLLVDEAHAYKNLQTISNIPDAAIAGSKRASDLHMKLEYLRRKHGERVVTMATATPIANSVTEAHVMSRYLRPDLLDQAGVGDFDAWAATFGQAVTEIEMAPTGGGNYRMKTRFARFQNVPEMLRLWHVFADLKTAEDLDLPAPELAERPDGQRAPHTVLIVASPEVRAYVQELGRRAELVRSRAVTPEEDNMLKISTDGRKAALDMRLVAGEPSTGPSKLQIAADTIAELHHRHRHDEYLDAATGERSPVPGALQVVFCDLSTPASDRWNAYHELRSLLEARGLPAASVQFIHDAGNDAEKARLFAACRAGHVSVLIGSTEKMGVGTNIQDRCIAIHHLDCPWRPADIEQRDGRGVRQGNQNPEIRIVRYAVEGSFDAYSWQTVERKARFINQIMRGRLDVREIEDIGENTLSFAEVKALASGDPLILDKARVDAEVTRLARLERAWQRNQHALRGTIAGAQDSASVLERRHQAVTDALACRRPTRGELFAMTIDRRQVTERAQAGRLLGAQLEQLAPGPPRPIAELGGLPVDAQLAADPATATLRVELFLHGLPTRPATLSRAELPDGAISLIRQLEHRLDSLEQLAGELDQRHHGHLREADSAREQLARPFRYAEDLAHARERQAAITEQMHARQATEPDSGEPSAPAPAADDELDPETAEALRLARLAQAHPIDQALHPPAVAARPARTAPSSTPSRHPSPHR